MTTKMQTAQISKPGGEWELVECNIPEPGPGQGVWLFCYDALNPGFLGSCPVVSRYQHWPPEMSCRCGRALGIAENLA